MKTLTLLLLAASCGCGTAGLTEARSVCYVNADQHAQQRVDSECKDATGSVHFASCPVKDAIMSELRASQEKCP